MYMEKIQFDAILYALLEPGKFDDFCPNGCLVDQYADKNIRKVVTGVSLRAALIAAAIERGADAIIVHHPNGFWKSEKDKRLVGTFGKYMSALARNDIALYGFHLPLDANVVVGNNATIYRTLGLDSEVLASDAQRFMDGIGYIGHGEITRELLVGAFPHGWTLVGPAFVPGKRYTVAICSGSGTSGLQEARDAGCDMFITGEIRESTTIFAEENGITVIAAGHHRSEVFCVRELAEFINSHSSVFPGVSAEFVDIDNPI